jgi:hypothetical protein
MKERAWNPKARKCSQCGFLKPIKDKQTKTVDPNKKLCDKWSWEIANDLAERQAVCREEKPRRSRRRQH